MVESQTARVIPWGGKPVASREAGDVQVPVEPKLMPIDEILIVMSDEQLDALGTLFLMSPARRAMTFEAYLAVRGFAREVA